jgi:hypothetical protein
MSFIRMLGCDMSERKRLLARQKRRQGFKSFVSERRFSNNIKLRKK